MTDFFHFECRYSKKSFSSYYHIYFGCEDVVVIFDLVLSGYFWGRENIWMGAFAGH